MPLENVSTVREMIHALIYFQPLSYSVNPEPILGMLDVRWNYVLKGRRAYSNNHSQVDADLSQLPVCFFLR